MSRSAAARARARRGAVYGHETVWAPTPEESAARDRQAREAHGVPARVLMENAGRAAALILDRLFPAGAVVGLVGGGDNGGDALVLLRTLAAWGRDVAWIAAGSRPPDDALRHAHELSRIDDPAAARAALATAAVVVDGILGTGAQGAPRPPADEWIEAANAAGSPVLALDLPSGVDAATGEVPGLVIQAAVTICFAAPKLGLLAHPARARCGRLMAVEIGFPPHDATDAPAAALITPAWAAARFPRRAPDAHKGSAGELLVLGGRAGVAGAAALAALGALRAGAGYLRVASAPENRSILQTLAPECVYVDRDDDAALAAAARAADAIVAGPGMGTDAHARGRLELALEAGDAPLLLDADALTLIGADAGRLAGIVQERPVVVTPHPGEMARLLDRETTDVLADPNGVAREYARRTGAIVLLKGQPSVVAAADAPLLINTAGSSDLATAGMGDVLSGAIGAFLAAGSTARDAAGAALFLASRAADIAALGVALSPRDAAHAFQQAREHPGHASPPFRLPFIIFDQPARW